MSGYANNLQGQQDSFRYNASYSSSASTTISKKNESGETSTLSVSLKTSHSYSETRYSPASREPANVYKAPAKPQTEALDGTENSPKNESGSALILAFIEQRLTADAVDGASKEDLQSRMNAGYEGFMQGYGEAVDVLESMGLFTGEVKVAVEQMLKDVLQGFADLADKFELTNPAGEVSESVEETPVIANNEATEQVAPAAPLNLLEDFIEENTRNNEAESLLSLIEPTQSFYAKLDAESASSRQYSFRLRTTDGDSVTIQSYANQGLRYQRETGDQGSAEQFNIAGMEQFHFSVQGELDAEELAAITNLLSQLNDVAGMFFDGDIYSAYEQALNVGYDSDEIARFSLNLRQTEYTRIENSYGAVAKADTEKHPLNQDPGHHNAVMDNKVARMSEFMQLLEKTLENGRRFNLHLPEMTGFANFAGLHRFAQHPHQPHFSGFMHNMGEALSHKA